LGGGFDTIATYTEDERAELIALAQSFDVMPRLAAARRAVATMAADGRPGDDFNREATWSGILEPAGWCSVCTRGDVSYWRRPDKTHGISATTNVGGSDLLYVFTSSTSFEPERAYTKFAAYATLEHAGNFSAAARALSERGYGTTAATTNAGKPTTVPSNDSGRSSLHPVLVCLADVRPELVKWIWPGRLAAGKLTLIVGDPGLGKSFLTLDIAARVSAGRVMPGGSPALTAAAVILMSAEDGVADTIRPRLDALGADVNEIHHLAVLRTGEHERAVQLADTASLEHAIRETDARVLIIDPLSAYLGSTDSHRDSEVRSLLAPLAALADRTGVAILGVMHLAKNSQQPAIYRAVGSIAFAASARIVLAVAADPERDDRRIVASVKSNLSAPPAALAYTIANGCLAWESDSISDVDIDALLAGPRVDRQGHHEVDTWLGELLADGPLPVRQVQAAAREMEFGWRTVERAKRRLNVVAERIGGMADSGQWRWLLPSAKTDTHDAVSALASHRENSTKNSGLSPKTDTSNLLSVLSANVSTLESPPDRPEEDNDGVF
jgi:putative DNA primase/helicase